MTTLNISQKNVNDGKNTFFKNNKMLIGTAAPTSGTYTRGDVVVNAGLDNDKNNMWICIESGSPGKWILIGGKPMITSRARVVITDPIAEVPMTELGMPVEKDDKLDVYLNSTHLLEGEDYIINSSGTKIRKKSGIWNLTGDPAVFDFVLMKYVDKVDGNNVTINTENRETKIASIVEKVQVIGTQTEVAIPNMNFNQEFDTLLVFKNGMIMIDGIDYQISNGNLVSLTGPWNQSNVDDYEMTFILLKEVLVYEGVIFGNFQEKIDNNLQTNDKTVVGAINELFQNANNGEALENFQEKIDNNLQTESKTVVGAINELFQSANSGKELIANAIGDESITKDSTFEAMGNAILEIRRKSEEDANEYIASLKLILTDEDVSVSDEDDMVSLITKVDEEFTKDSNTINDLNTSIENTRSTLASLMQEGGYDITDNEDIDSLLELLALSGLNISEIRQIACSQSHTVILKNDRSVWTCGYNSNGQLGLGTSDTNAHNVFTQVTININNDVKQIACGYYHTVILKTDGSVWGCGNAQYGQLGLGNFNNQTSFTQVTTNINNDVKQIACGYNHTFILKTDGSLWACGNNEYGQLGLGDTNEYCTSFTQVTTNINNDVKQIACGQYHTFILKNDGSIWACGNAKYGQLGLGNYNNQTTFTQVTTNINNDVKRIACGYNHTFISKNDGSIWSCGLNSKGQLGLNDTTKRTTFTQVTTNINNDVKQLVCGDAFTFILKNDGSLWTCGYNYRGQLGLGTSDTNAHSVFTQVTTNINNDVKRIACGYYHTVISKNDGSVWACGYNNRGQLGLNDTTNRTTFTQVPRGF